MSPPAVRRVVTVSGRLAVGVGLFLAPVLTLGGPPEVRAGTPVAAVVPAVTTVPSPDASLPAQEPEPQPQPPTEPPTGTEPGPATPTLEPEPGPATPAPTPDPEQDPEVEDPAVEDPATALLAGPAAAALGTGPTVGSALLTASTASLEGLSVEGVVEVGGLEVLKVSAAAGVLRDMALATACFPVGAGALGMQNHTVTAPGAMATAAGGMTLYAASITFTTPLGDTTWTPEALPPVSDFPEVLLTDLAVDMVSVEMPSLGLPGMAQSTSFCAP